MPALLRCPSDTWVGPPVGFLRVATLGDPETAEGSLSFSGGSGDAYPHADKGAGITK